MTEQIEIQLPPYPKGLHLITNIIKEKLFSLPEKGMVNIFIKHTSAALTINENADPTAKMDLEAFIDYLIPEGLSMYRHTAEGSDDMPAHIKASFIGPSITVPVKNSKLNLGIWQGIYLCEFRNHGGGRKLVITVYS